MRNIKRLISYIFLLLFFTLLQLNRYLSHVASNFLGGQPNSNLCVLCKSADTLAAQEYTLGLYCDGG